MSQKCSDCVLYVENSFGIQRCRKWWVHGGVLNSSKNHDSPWKNPHDHLAPVCPENTKTKQTLFQVTQSVQVTRTLCSSICLRSGSSSSGRAPRYLSCLSADDSQSNKAWPFWWKSSACGTINLMSGNDFWSLIYSYTVFNCNKTRLEFKIQFYKSKALHWKFLRHFQPSWIYAISHLANS